ncbi:putative reverse transcriptase domain-containing protein [Tanacetum coccineum]|uniref:Reverse transcriptase domain-containing protein n=1 Tax=Tanacetum coccineum TaxID=301880 RepID=A0ABQ5J1N2_9ASTR
MPVEMGTYDVIIGMDWLTKYQAIIDCAKKIVRIPFGSEILIFHGDGSRNKAGLDIEHHRVYQGQKYVLQGCHAFHLPDKWNFNIDLVPGAAPYSFLGHVFDNKGILVDPARSNRKIWASPKDTNGDSSVFEVRLGIFGVHCSGFSKIVPTNDEIIPKKIGMKISIVKALSYKKGLGGWSWLPGYGDLRTVYAMSPTNELISPPMLAMLDLVIKVKVNIRDNGFVVQPKYLNGWWDQYALDFVTKRPRSSQARFVPEEVVQAWIPVSIICDRDHSWDRRKCLADLKRKTMELRLEDKCIIKRVGGSCTYKLELPEDLLVAEKRNTYIYVSNLKKSLCRRTLAVPLDGLHSE